MTLEEYQSKAKKTAIYKKESQVIYPLLGLLGEVGELANKLKKVLRDTEATELSIHTIPTRVHREVQDELGDVFWYLVVLMSDLKIPIEDTLQNNLDKLASRQFRGKLKGSGDKR